MYFHFSDAQVMTKLRGMKMACKKMAQQLNTTGGGRDLGPLEPFWPALQRIFGQTHCAELPASVGVDFDPSTGQLLVEDIDDSETQFSAEHDVFCEYV